jgi:hypothetical protein
MPRPPIAIRPSAVRWPYMWEQHLSPRVSPPPQPISSHTDCGRGSVTIIELFIGSQVRRSPAKEAV